MRTATLSAPPVFSLTERTDERVTLTSDTGAVAHIFVLEEDIVRLLLLPDGVLKGPPSWAIAPGEEDIAEPGRDRMSVKGFACPEFQITRHPREGGDPASLPTPRQKRGPRLRGDDEILVIATTKIRLTIQLNGFRCLWEQATPEGWRRMTLDRPTQSYDFGWWDGKVHHYTTRLPDERIYGLGERSGAMDRTGRRFRMINLDALGYDAKTADPLYKTIPYYLTAQADGLCHGTFYDTMAAATFDFGAEYDNYHFLYRHFEADHGDLDLYMIAGPDPAAVTRRFTWLTGKPAFMPRWSVGYSGSTMSYTDAPDAQAQMAKFVERLEEHDIGCSSFHFSSGYTSIGTKRYVFNWNREKFPDPAAFVQSYADAGIRLVPNIKPALLHDHPRYEEVAAKGLFVHDSTGAPIETQYWDAVGSCLDFTKPETAKWWRHNLTTALLDYGFQASWNDNNEYEIWDVRARIHGFGQPRAAVECRPLQPLLMMRASRAKQIEYVPGKRPYVVTRSGMAGLHRYAQTWSGDNLTSWRTLRYNIKMGLGLALSGVSNAGHDVGGFAGPAPDAELLTRWVQAGVMMPRFSIHSWNDDGTVNEPWMHESALPAIQRLMGLRQTLTPFFYDLLHRYAEQYEPVLRPLWFDHVADKGAWADTDDQMLGRDLLVALAVDPGVSTRVVRPPAGSRWYDVWTGAVLDGGVAVEILAPLDGPPPLLAREGSGMFVDLARGGFRPEARERGVWLFPPVGDGAFSWEAYEDDGESAGGDHAIWRIDGEARGNTLTLTVSKQGDYGDAALTILLPSSDARVVRIVGGNVTIATSPTGRDSYMITLG